MYVIGYDSDRQLLANWADGIFVKTGYERLTSELFGHNVAFLCDTSMLMSPHYTSLVTMWTMLMTLAKIHSISEQQYINY